MLSYNFKQQISGGAQGSYKVTEYFLNNFIQEKRLYGSLI